MMSDENLPLAVLIHAIVFCLLGFDRLVFTCEWWMDA